MKDLLLDDNNDLLVQNGDLAVGNSDLQHQKLLLETAKGEWKQHPLAGVGMEEFLMGENPEGLFAEIRAQMLADGAQVRRIGFKENGNIIIDANYNR